MNRIGFTSYFIVFIIPTVIRSIPELIYRFPLGPDTPHYMYIMKYGGSGLYIETNVFYILIKSLGDRGIDPIIFFKIYPPIVFGLTCLFIAIYLHMSRGWNIKNLILFSIVYSFTPALLRISWDLQRQNFALMLLALSMSIYIYNRLGQRTRWILIGFNNILIAFTHELILAISLGILGWMAINYRDGRSLYPLLIIFITVAAYIVVRTPIFLKIPELLIVENYQQRFYRFTSEWMRLDMWLSIIILSFGLQLPLIILGIYMDDILIPWSSITIIAYISFLNTSASILLPDRWLYLAGIPAAIYASNYLNSLNLDYIKVAILMGLLAIQPTSMLGIMPLPLTIYSEKRYGTFPDLLSPSISESKIDALIKFREEYSGDYNVLVVDWTMKSWAKYIYSDKEVIPDDTPKGISMLKLGGEGVIYATSKELKGWILIFSYNGVNFYDLSG